MITLFYLRAALSWHDAREPGGRTCVFDVRKVPRAPMSKAILIIWALRILAGLIVLAAATLPYARASNGLQPNLLQFVQSFQYIGQHKQLTPILLVLMAGLVGSIFFPTVRPLLWTIAVAGGLWGGLMLAIPLGMAHVHPIFGYWVGQGLLLIEGVLLGIVLFGKGLL